MGRFYWEYSYAFTPEGVRKRCYKVCYRYDEGRRWCFYGIRFWAGEDTYLIFDCRCRISEAFLESCNFPEECKKVKDKKAFIETIFRLRFL